MVECFYIRFDDVYDSKSENRNTSIVPIHEFSKWSFNTTNPLGW